MDYVLLRYKFPLTPMVLGRLKTARDAAWGLINIITTAMDQRCKSSILPTRFKMVSNLVARQLSCHAITASERA